MKRTKTFTGKNFDGWLPLSALLPFSLGAALNYCQTSALAADPLNIQNLTVDANQNIVIGYAPHSGNPSNPVLQDMPGASHKLVLDFPGSVIDRTMMPSAANSLATLSKAFPQVRGIRYAIVNGGVAPAARIVLDFPPDLPVTPSVVNVADSAITINLGIGTATTAAAPQAESAAPKADATSAPTNTADSSLTRIQPQDMEESTPAIVTTPQPSSSPQPTVASTPAASETPVAPAASAEETTKPATLEATSVAAEATSPAPAATVAEPKTEATEPAAKPAPATAAAPDLESPARPLETVVTAPTKVVEAPRTTVDAEPEATPKVVHFDSPEQLLAKTTPAVSPAQESNSLSETAAAVPKPVAVTPEGQPKATEATTTVPELPAVSSKPAREETTQAPDASQKLVASAGGSFDANSIPKTSPELDPLAGINAADAKSASEAPKAAAVSPEAARKHAEAENHFKAAVKFHVSGNFEAAKAEYKATIAIDPRLAEPYCNLGLIYNQQHNYRAALDEFHKALAVNPKDAITYNGIGAALRAERDMPGAIKNWQTAVQFDPNLATAYYNLGTAYEIEKDYDKAIDSYRQAANHDRRLGEAYYRTGLILQHRNSTTAAIEEFNKALRASAKAEYSEDAKQRIASLSKRVTR